MATPLEQMQPRSRWNLRDNQDIVLSFCVIGILVVLVIPLPTWILDTLLTVNISLSVVVWKMAPRFSSAARISSALVRLPLWAIAIAPP